MKTALEALKEHRATFWQATDCDAWMAKEALLLAEIARENGARPSIIADHESYARQQMEYANA